MYTRRSSFNFGPATFLPAFVVFTVLSASVLSGCGDADGASSPAETEGQGARIVQVETVKIQNVSFDDYIELTGTVEAIEDVILSAETGGQLTYVADRGKVVSRSGVVARIDDRLVRSAFEATEAQYNLANDTYKRQEALYRDSVISALEFETARAQRDQLAAMYRQTEKSLGDTRLRSPISGRIESRSVEAGEMVAPGTPVMRIVNTRQVKIATGIPERYAGDVKVGTDVSAAFDIYGSETRNGKVAFVGNVIDPLSRTFDVEIAFDNSNGALKPEMVANISIVRQRIDSALVVPQTAIITDENGAHVFVVETIGAEKSASRRSVVRGPSFDGRTVILEGVRPQEEIVVVGQIALATGDLVSVETAHESTAAYYGRSSLRD